MSGVNVLLLKGGQQALHVWKLFGQVWIAEPRQEAGLHIVKRVLSHSHPGQAPW